MSPAVLHLWAEAAATLAVRSTLGGGNSDLVTDQVVTLPTNETGDVVFIGIRSGTAVTFATPTGWTALITNAATSWTGLYYRVLDGTEAATVTFVASGTTRTAWTTLSVQSVATTEAAFAEAALATSEDPPNVTASWGAADNLAITFLLARTNDWEATAPTGYAGTFFGQTEASAASTRCRAYGAYRDITTAAEDPGVWTITVGATETPRAITLVVRPAA